MFSSYVNQQYNPYVHGMILYGDGHSGEGAFVVVITTCNLYYNCVIAYEVLLLLRNSHNAKKCDPPSLRRVTLQAIAVYIFSVCVGVIHYTITQVVLEKAWDNGNRLKWRRFRRINLVWAVMVSLVCPVVFLACVTAIIWYRKYMPSATGRMRELVSQFKIRSRF